MPDILQHKVCPGCGGKMKVVDITVDADLEKPLDENFIRAYLSGEIKRTREVVTCDICHGEGIVNA